MKKTLVIIVVCSLLASFYAFPHLSGTADAAGLTYVVVDTGQDDCYGTRGQNPINDPGKGEPLYGQDAQYDGVQPAYRDNGDGTVTDLNTGLEWQQAPPTQTMHWDEALDYAADLRLGGKSDWRLPTIKELLSIVDFNGTNRTKTPYINTRYFDYYYPADVGQNRDMDGQYWSSTESVARTMGNDESAFGFNFADGRIKAYPKFRMNGFVRCVRGNTDYGKNDFKDNGDGTVSDKATGLMWMQADSGKTMDWTEALEYAENLNYAGYSDWRLPNAKELQSIVDYTRATDHPNASRRSAAIDPVFDVTEDESWFWTSTTLLEDAATAVYVAFGRGTAYDGLNVHGSGCLRSDPKVGDPDDYPRGRGPQNDEIRIYNYVRCVRGGGDTTDVEPNKEINLATAQVELSEDTLRRGDKITIRSKVVNRGSETSVKTLLTYYLSSNKRLNDSDYYIGKKLFNPLEGGEVRWVKKNWTVPAGLERGDYFLLVIADEANLSGEKFTGNNDDWARVTIY